MLYRILYASRLPAKTKVSAMAALAKSIAEQSAATNAALGVTGALCVSNADFVQVLEGSREAINKVYARIVADPRHSDVTLLSYEAVAERLFEHWSMAHLDIKRVNSSVIIKYAPTTVLDPFAIEPQQLLKLLKELLSSVAAVRRT